MRLAFALLLIAINHLPARAQPLKGNESTVAGCPAATKVTQAWMLGLWRAEFSNPAQAATLLLEPNASHPGSFSGAINRNGEQARLAGDIEDGEFSLEESADGVRISATWVGDVVENSCGHEVRGDWQAAPDGPLRPFVLRKLAEN